MSSGQTSTGKRKNKALPTLSQEVDNGPSQTYRLLAPNPTDQAVPQGKPLGHQGTCSIRSPLLAYPWSDHLEQITALVVELSHIYRNARCAIPEPFYDLVRPFEQLALLSENLQRSYLGLKECVRPSLIAWQLHLDQINFIAAAVSQIPQIFMPPMIQLLDINMALLCHRTESLQKGFFALKGVVQQ